MSKVIDLDILRPEPQIVKIDGREIDVSFIPTGITFDLDDIVQELVKIDTKKIASSKSEGKRAFDLGIKLCSIFCKTKYPEMDEEWFYKNTSPQQIARLSEAIQKSLFDIYAGIAAHTKN